jgi:hypothetical protein
VKKLLLLLALCIMPTVAQSTVGRVSEQTGSSVEIRRGSSSIQGQQNTPVESMDTVLVGSRAETNITFQDNTRVKIKENSRLVIDSFVFDPNRSDAGRMAMRVTLGTVQYTSGQIARTNRQNLNIATPTATIAVRGTDMAMSVDEVGRSFVVLLPSCNDPREINRFEISGNCTVGVIDVITSAGTVTLNQPFTATYVVDANQQPLPPVRIEANIATISNDLALRKPENILAAEQQRNEARERNRNRSVVSAEEQRAASSSNAESNQQQSESTSTRLLVSSTAEMRGDVSPTNPCWPFNACGNERGRNWYHREDEQRNNVIRIYTGERTDNTTYSISINDIDTQSRVSGDGGSRVTVRIWNR